jgi:hypothetical protein
MDANAELLERVEHVFEAAARQRDVPRVILGAGNDAWLVVGREPHRLRVIKLRVLKGRKPQQPVPQSGEKRVLGDVDLIAEDQFKCPRQFADERGIVPAP